MSTISKNSKYCCTCKYFGGKAKLRGSIIEYENTMHVCKLSSGTWCNKGAMNSACSKWEERND